MRWRLIRTIIILPGTALVFIPAAIFYTVNDSKFSHELAAPGHLLFWLALMSASLGFGLAFWTVKLFMKFGQGTPAPWDPPKKLVVRGPYRHVRNPMITSVLIMLFSEAALLQSWPIAAWMMVFFIANAIYFPLFEEKDLQKRFGDDYREYCAHVPRWIPKLQPWKPVNLVQNKLG